MRYVGYYHVGDARCGLGEGCFGRGRYEVGFWGWQVLGSDARHGYHYCGGDGEAGWEVGSVWEGCGGVVDVEGETYTRMIATRCR